MMIWDEISYVFFFMIFPFFQVFIHIRRNTESLERHFYLLLITYYLLLITYQLLLITNYLLIATYYFSYQGAQWLSG